MKVAELKKQLNSSDIDNVYLFCGEEEFLKTKYLDMLRDEFGKSGFEEFNISVFEYNNYSLKDMDNILEQMPVMAERKLVILKDSRVFGITAKKGYSDYVEYWKERIKDVPDHTCLVFSETEVDKRSAIYKYIQKEYSVVEFDLLSDADLIKWITKLLNDSGKKMEDIPDFISRCEKGMSFVYNELMKLIEYVGGRDTITKEDVEFMVKKTLNSYIFDIIDAVIVKDSNKAVCGLGSLYEQKESPIAILAVLTSNLGKILQAKYALESGGGYMGVSAALNEKRSFLVNKYINYANKFTAEQLRGLIAKGSECDIKLKRSVIKPEEELMFYVLNTLA